jgi:hypothetical protein
LAKAGQAIEDLKFLLLSALFALCRYYIFGVVVSTIPWDHEWRLVTNLTAKHWLLPHWATGGTNDFRGGLTR